MPGFRRGVKFWFLYVQVRLPQDLFGAILHRALPGASYTDRSSIDAYGGSVCDLVRCAGSATCPVVLPTPQLGQCKTKHAEIPMGPGTISARVVGVMPNCLHTVALHYTVV